MVKVTLQWKKKSNSRNFLKLFWSNADFFLGFANRSLFNSLVWFGFATDPIPLADTMSMFLHG